VAGREGGAVRAKWVGFIWRDTGALARATAGAAAERRTPGRGGVGKKTRSYVCIVFVLDCVHTGEEEETYWKVQSSDGPSAGRFLVRA